MKYRKGDIFICEEDLYRSKIISFVNEEYRYGEDDTIDEEMSIISWEVFNVEAFDEKVCKYKKVDSIQELLDSGRNTYPFSFAGDMTYKSFKSYLKRNKMYKSE